VPQDGRRCRRLISKRLEEFTIQAQDVEELKVYPAGGQLVVHVPGGRGEELRLHLESHGVRLKVSPTAQRTFERLEVEGDVDPETLQAIVDQWGR